MLSGYFDDSGTHDDSEVVVWAGLFGNRFQWAALDDAWGQALKACPPKCRPLTHFHMVRCESGTGEFAEDDTYQRWPRSEREALAKNLRKIINGNMLSGIGIGVARKIWDELITDEDRRRVDGDAEGWAIRMIMVRATDWAISRECERDPDFAMIFDRRRTGEITAVHKMIANEVFRDKINLFRPSYQPNILPNSFMDAGKTHQLQAADLFAWEFYQVVRDVVVNKASHRPQRAQMRELIDGANGRLKGILIEEEQVREIVAKGRRNSAEIVKRLPKSWNWKVK
ncbi:MAG: hypothetical protein Q7T86_19445 [Hyphomicrobiaceae bacterium]|nr:hypothetical protein [Hyphomicrobiaceae bacterium]